MATEKRLIDIDDIDYENIIASQHQLWLLHGFLESLPTVDAVEVVHGEWSTIEDDYTGMTALQCSECNQEWWFEDEPPMRIYKYCPNCGADMRERKDNG